MTMSDGPRAEPGLPGDRGETGPVLRVKDVLRPIDEGAADGVAILGFASDEGVRRNFGRVGAAEGPAAIRAMLERLPVHCPGPLYDAGDVACTDGRLEEAQARLADRLAVLLDRGIRPVVLGGGHEIAFGSFSGLAKHLGEGLARTKVLIVNIDAHFDLRLAPVPNSGTPFRQIAELCAEKGAAFDYLCFGISDLSNTTALFERAHKLGVSFWRDEEMRLRDSVNLQAALAQRLMEADKVYLTIDLDVLPASVAPGVSAPAARGVSLEIVEDLVDEILSSGKLALADIAELNPSLDRDGQTARIAARLAHRLAFGRR
jgi:formiminoglutamase